MAGALDPVRSQDATASSVREWRCEALNKSGGTNDDVIYQTIERRIRDLDAGGDVLDFGAGRGRLTARLHESKRFQKVAGADLFERPSDLAAGLEWIQGDLNDRLPAPAGSFDAVIAAEVIEHLENPRAVCRELFRLLRPGGIVVLSTPNNESLRSVLALLVRGHFVAFGDTAYPAHITALTRKDIQRVLSEAGFVDVRFAFTEHGGIPGLPSRTWQSVLGGLARDLRFSDNVVASARKPSI